MKDIRVSFPEPCSEQWDTMTPRGCNRHCASCDKIIYDLSSMTVGEVEAALDGNDELCVRAKVRPDGSIRTAETPQRSSRRIMAALGASASLALAACQTTGTPAVSPRYQISGNVGDGWASSATLVSDTGKTYSARLWSDQKFRFSNLLPGTYTLSFIGTCEEVHRMENVALGADLDLGEVKFDEDSNDCIIIGLMERVPNSRGA